MIFELVLALGCLQDDGGDFAGGASGPPASRPASAWPSQATIITSDPGDDLLGNVEVDTFNEQLIIQWMWEDGGVRYSHRQHESLPYWPTAAIWDSGDLYVAGVYPAGNTIVDRWSFEFPEIPSGHVYTTGFSTSRIFDKNKQNQRVVKAFEPLAGSSGGALMHFADSNRVFAMDLTSGAVALLFTPALIPQLTNDYVRIAVAEHAQLGYVYAYHGIDGLLTETLVLIDSNKDGSIETFQVFSDSAWIAMLLQVQDWVQIFS